MEPSMEEVHQNASGEDELKDERQERQWVRVPVQDCSDDEEAPMARPSDKEIKPAALDSERPRKLESAARDDPHAEVKTSTLTASYKRWDKFDADAALEASSDEEKAPIFQQARKEANEASASATSPTEDKMPAIKKGFFNKKPDKKTASPLPQKEAT